MEGIIKINKNRGWRGLAEVQVYINGVNVHSEIFSFSPNTWYDLIDKHIIVISTENKYKVIELADVQGLPKPTQQRSVLIKDFSCTKFKITEFDKTDWIAKTTDVGHYLSVRHYLDNNNAHTTSDFNNIGIRVYPKI